MSLKMQKTLQLERPTPGMGLNELISLIERNNEAIQRAYEAIWSDIHYKEWIFFTRQKKLWRLGPVGDHLCAQYFIGTNINEKSQWTNSALWETEWTSYGGTD